MKQVSWSLRFVSAARSCWEMWSRFTDQHLAGLIPQVNAWTWQFPLLGSTGTWHRMGLRKKNARIFVAGGRYQCSSDMRFKS
jgi:hypothetical protein